MKKFFARRFTFSGIDTKINGKRKILAKKIITFSVGITLIISAIFTVFAVDMLIDLAKNGSKKMGSTEYANKVVINPNELNSSFDNGDIAPYCSLDNILVDGGSGYSMLLKSDGTLWGWGQNNYGQLGGMERI